jgi:hypothetical protein
VMAHVGAMRNSITCPCRAAVQGRFRDGQGPGCARQSSSPSRMRPMVAVPPPSALPAGVDPRRNDLGCSNNAVTSAEVASTIAQRAARGEPTVEGAGGTNAPPRVPQVCPQLPLRGPGTSRDSVQAVVLPARHGRPVTSPMTQLGGPVECPKPVPGQLSSRSGFLASNATLGSSWSNQVMRESVAGQAFSTPCASGGSGLHTSRSSVSCPSASQKPP